MLELNSLAEAGRLVEAAIPLLDGASPVPLPDSLPVVQALLAALEQATEAPVDRGRPNEALEAARAGLERLRLAHHRLAVGGRPSTAGREAMLATRPELPH